MPQPEYNIRSAKIIGNVVAIVNDSKKMWMLGLVKRRMISLI